MEITDKVACDMQIKASAQTLSLPTLSLTSIKKQIGVEPILQASTTEDCSIKNKETSKTLIGSCFSNYKGGE